VNQKTMRASCHSCLSWKRCALTSLKHPTTSKCPKMLNKTSKSLSARIFGPYLSFVKGTLLQDSRNPTRTAEIEHHAKRKLPKSFLEKQNFV
jgi:hypothetical protein